MKARTRRNRAHAALRAVGESHLWTPDELPDEGASAAETAGGPRKEEPERQVVPFEADYGPGYSHW